MKRYQLKFVHIFQVQGSLERGKRKKGHRSLFWKMCVLSIGSFKYQTYKKNACKKQEKSRILKDLISSTTPTSIPFTTFQQGPEENSDLFASNIHESFPFHSPLPLVGQFFHAFTPTRFAFDSVDLLRWLVNQEMDDWEEKIKYESLKYTNDIGCWFHIEF